MSIYTRSGHRMLLLDRALQGREPGEVIAQPRAVLCLSPASFISRDITTLTHSK